MLEKKTRCGWVSVRAHNNVCVWGGEGGSIRADSKVWVGTMCMCVWGGEGVV